MENLVPDLKQAAEAVAIRKINKHIEEVQRIMNIKDVLVWLPDLPVFDGKGIWKKLNVTEWGITIYIPWNADIIEATLKAFTDANWELALNENGEVPDPRPGYNYVDIEIKHERFTAATKYYGNVTLRIFAEITLEDNPDVAMQQGCVVELESEEVSSYKTPKYRIRCKEDVLNANRQTTQPDSEPA